MAGSRSGGDEESPWAGLVDPHLPYEEDPVAQAFVGYFKGAPREEVAQALGYSREWVRRIEAEAMRKFREELELHGWAFEDVLLALAASDPEGCGEEYLTADPDAHEDLTHELPTASDSPWLP